MHNRWRPLCYAFRCEAHGTKKAADYPQELLNLFDRYVHGDIDRRTFWKRQEVRRWRCDGHAIWESLRPNYAWAEQSQGR